MSREDINADIEMRFVQIISLADLLLEVDDKITPNILTLRDIAQSGLNKMQEI